MSRSYATTRGYSDTCRMCGRTNTASSALSANTAIASAASSSTDLMMAVGAFPTRSHTTLGRWPVHEGQLVEVGVLRHDREPVGAGELPHLPVGRCAETDRDNVDALRVDVAELVDEEPGQVLVEQQLHTEGATRRSRNAANSSAARTCSAVSSGKSLTISSVVIPPARYSNTS